MTSRGVAVLLKGRAMLGSRPKFVIAPPEIHNLDLDGAVDTVQRRIAAGRDGVAGVSALRAANTALAVTQAKAG